MNDPLTPLPMLVISGYLGAGKTTLINQVLQQANGRKIMVLVNDFGAINIDADLLESADEDTLTLTNGCVCCTMGADLFMALGDALDRRPRPDILLIEASGIAEPRNIAEAAKAEPDLRYGGIVTVIDAQNFLVTQADPQIGPQIRDQVRSADLLVLTKSSGADAVIFTQLAMLNSAPVLMAQNAGLADLMLDRPQLKNGISPRHPPYASWNYTGSDFATRAALDAGLASPPKGVYRLKGRIRGPSVGGWEVHLVGNTIEIIPLAVVHETALVAIGPKDNFTPNTANDWWQNLLQNCHLQTHATS